MTIDWPGLLPWLVTASIVAFGYWRRARRRLDETALAELQPLISRPLPVEVSRDELLGRLQACFAAPEYSVINEPSSTRLIVDQKRIGAFHWGFVFILVPMAGGRWEAGVFPKGPNPPRGAALQRHLDDFCASIEQEAVC